MYNPYGTIRSWIANSLIFSVSSRIHPEYTLMTNLLTAESYINGMSDEEYQVRYHEIAKEYGSTFGGSLAISASALFLLLSFLLHRAAHVDACLEVTRIFLRVTDK